MSGARKPSVLLLCASWLIFHALMLPNFLFLQSRAMEMLVLWQYLIRRIHVQAAARLCSFVLGYFGRTTVSEWVLYWYRKLKRSGLGTFWTHLGVHQHTTQSGAACGRVPDRAKTIFIAGARVVVAGQWTANSSPCAAPKFRGWPPLCQRARNASQATPVLSRYASTFMLCRWHIIRCGKIGLPLSMHPMFTRTYEHTLLCSRTRVRFPATAVRISMGRNA